MKTILVIDDSKADQSNMKTILEKGGYSVISAVLGPEGLTLCRERKPDLIILDLIMPDMNGIEVLREFKIEFPDIPVVMCSAAGLEQVVALAIRVGAAGYIVKPYEEDTVLSTLQKIFNS